MNLIEKKKNDRFNLMKAMYELTGGTDTKQVALDDLENALSYSDDDFEYLIEIVNYLVNEKLLKVVRITMGIPGVIFLMHKGIVEVEQAMSNPEKETEHFKQAINITNNIGSMVNSNLQQATKDSSLTVNYYLNNNEKDNLKELISQLKNELILSPPSLNEEQQQDLKAEISTIESQLLSSKPKKSILIQSSETLVEILKGAAGSGVWEVIKAITVVTGIA